MADSPASYIRMVQHLIENCLIFHMNQEECAEALSKHANIKPVITNTVWKELEKENKEFFEAYAKKQRDEEQGSSEEQKERQQVLDMLSDFSVRDSDED